MAWEQQRQAARQKRAQQPLKLPAKKHGQWTRQYKNAGAGKGDGMKRRKWMGTTHTNAPTWRYNRRQRPDPSGQPDPQPGNGKDAETTRP
eukprot:15235473-Ditylum_brightwellii.AAC.1